MLCVVSDRRSLLAGLVTEPSAANERSHGATAHTQPQQQHSIPDVTATQQSEASDADSPHGHRDSNVEQEQTDNSSGERSAGDGDSEQSEEISALDSDTSSHIAASASLTQPDPVQTPSPSAPAASTSSRPAAINTIAVSSFPFFPYVIADPSCCLPAASLTASLAANDSRLSSAVLECVLVALTDACTAASHRLYGGVAVANVPLHSDSPNQPPSSQHSQQQHQQRGGDSGSSLVAGVSDFVGPLTALSALLSVSDRLSDSRVDECLSRLLVLARRVCSRRPSGLSPSGAVCINGSEERFLLQFVRTVLQLAANVKPVAVWLRAHQGEWHFLETLYTQARHLTGMQIIKT